MADRRPVFTLYKNIYPESGERIRIPQNTYKPVVIRTRKNVKYTDKDPWFWVKHHRGVRRTDLNQDPLEMRAVPLSYVRGTLPERIVYKTLVEYNLNANVDFDFQSSLFGGRLELGGIVADFIIERMGLVLQVQGPTHDSHLRKAKDEEQRLMLAHLGLDVIELEDDLIYNEWEYELYMRRLLMTATAAGTSTGDYIAGGKMGGLGGRRGNRSFSLEENLGLLIAKIDEITNIMEDRYGFS